MEEIGADNHTQVLGNHTEVKPSSSARTPTPSGRMPAASSHSKLPGQDKCLVVEPERSLISMMAHLRPCRAHHICHSLLARNALTDQENDAGAPLPDFLSE